MRQVAGLIPTYSSDEFGICSSLYELGGMVVMHDASGCNSTYTTHDEPRWYTQESLIFISAISEIEAIMGNDRKFLDDVIETAKTFEPAFAALVGAPIPYMIGTDFDAISCMAEEELGIPVFGFAANGMQNYTVGIEMAMETILRRFCTEKDLTKDPGKKEKGLRVNIFGLTPLDFPFRDALPKLKAWMEKEDLIFASSLALESSLTMVKDAAEADVTLVVSYGGLRAAKYLYETFQIPYVIGVPFGTGYAHTVADTLRRAAAEGKPASLAEWTENSKGNGKIIVIGETVSAVSLANALEAETGETVRAICPLEATEEMLRSQDIQAPDEDDLIREIRSAQTIYADPFYKVLCNKEQNFYAWPHTALSGRIYEKTMKFPVGERLDTTFDMKE